MQRMSSLAVVVCSIILALVPGAAHAAPVGGVVILGFGASYPAGDGVAVHRGVDVACAGGEDVESPLAGEIGFVGRVPSAAGGTMLAVTIQTAHGNLTLMPLADAVVARGQRVDAGQRLGTVSAAGDPSSPGTHLHVGLKRAGMYLDPSEVLRAPSQAERCAEDGAPSDAAAPDLDNAVAGSNGALLAPAPGTSTAGRAQSVRSGAGGVMPEGVTLADAARTEQQSAQGGAMEPSIDDGGSARIPVAAAVGVQPMGAPALQGVGLPAAYAPPASPLSSAAGVLVDALPTVPGISPRGAAVLAASILAGATLLARRSLRRRVIASSVSDRLGYLLQHLKAGDTLRGLTSCPGPLPSQSRGRIAQGR